MTTVTVSGMGVSCGVHEIGDLYAFLNKGQNLWKTPRRKPNRKKNVLDVLKLVASQEITDPYGEENFCTPSAFLIFSDNTENRCGQWFAAYIKRHGLGGVTQTPYVVNPNSGNRIAVWVWQVNWDALDAHLATHNIDGRQLRNEAYDRCHGEEFRAL